MQARAIYASFVVGVLAVASCAVGVEDEDESLLDDLDESGDEELGSIEQGVAKGRPLAVNGAAGYCKNPASPCASGEGDCDSSAECASGLTCGQNNGLSFGLPAIYDVCVPSHCTNKVLDAGSGESNVDDGGPCGVRSACVGTAGGAGFCLGCLCASGEGDCDSSAECASGLSCGQNNGLSFGLPAIHDVCVPSHCTNKVLDAASGETNVDDGGPCGVRSACIGTSGDAAFCLGCRCASGAGDCDSNLECASGLTCAFNIGAKFDLPVGYDVCVPPHCTNHRHDAASGENGVDRGGPCESPCGNGGPDSGEVCDDGVNDGVLCSADCSAAGPEVARIHLHCDAGSQPINLLSGTACIVIGAGGASFITFSSTAVKVTLYSNGDCTGNTKTVSANMNFCQNSFDQGGGLNDQVRSVQVSRR